MAQTPQELNRGRIATYGIVVSSNVKEAALKRDIADANARASEAELALAKCRTGRSLSVEQRKTLLELLTQAPKGHVIVKPNFVDSEARGFATQISAVFNEAGFEGVGDAALQIVSIGRPGLFLAVMDSSKPPPHTEPILRAFAAAHIPIESGYADWVPDLNTVVIMVGRQP